jgi:SSS family solute:Na+ symporter/sodium/pantothenate symporter
VARIVVPAQSIFVAAVTGVDQYAYGADQAGVYLTAPGPSAKGPDGFLPLGLAVSFFFFWTFSGAGQPSNMVRMMSFNSSLTLRRAMMLVAVYFSLIYFPLVMIFCCGRVLLPGMEIESDRIMPALAEHVTRAAGWPWLAGLLVAAPFAAVMSTVDSFLLMISSAIVRDVYQRDVNPHASEKTMRRLTYAVTALVGVAALLGALNPPEYLQSIIVFTTGGLSACFLVPMSLALYWSRYNAAGAIASMLGGFFVHSGLYAAGWYMNDDGRPLTVAGFDPLIPDIILSLAIGVLVAICTRPPDESLVAKYFHAAPTKSP